MPDCLVIIGPNAFAGSSIQSIKIPKSVKYIMESTFENSAISSIEFEKDSNLTEIHERAFKGCWNLRSIVIPAKVTTISQEAFFECHSLDSFTFEENSQLTRLNRLFNCSIKEITIPKTVKEIASAAFKDLFLLETVRFEDNSELKILSVDCFANCYFLTTVDFGKNSKLVWISPNAFSGDTRLTNVNIPQSVIEIGYHAFENTDAISTITIPSSVEKIEDFAFCGWKKNQVINIENRLSPPSTWQSDWNKNCNATIVWGYKSK